MLTFKASLWRLGGQKFKHQIFLKFLRYDLFRYTGVLLFCIEKIHIFFAYEIWILYILYKSRPPKEINTPS